MSEFTGKKAFVLMTAMPPTKGHVELVKFAASLVGAGMVTVVLNTQPDEPYAMERAQALRREFYGFAQVKHLHDYRPQTPEELPEFDFWGMWHKVLEDYGFLKGDYIVASEPYGMKLAEVMNGIFMPYDISREIHFTKATNVREALYYNFDYIAPEFQGTLMRRVTIFGAESTGKTTLSRSLSRGMNAHWLPEWARPYLETVGNEITWQSMKNIWQGQKALQLAALNFRDKPLIIQDTDLYSTLGYWRGMLDKNYDHPRELEKDAERLKSSLYIITPSNIPFEPDPLRYGGDHRELDDEFWINLAIHFDLNYVVLKATTETGRLVEANSLILDFYNTTVAPTISYQRVEA